jgi:voltage-gated potassium channel
MLFRLLRRFWAYTDHSGVKILKALLGVGLLNILFGMGYYYFEHPVRPELNLLDSIWWAAVTMTTVGYGDISPTSLQGRFLVAYPCFLFGVGLLGYLIAIITEAVIDRITRKRKGTMKITLKNHILICNCPGTDKILKILDELEGDPETRDKPVVIICDNIQELPEPLRKRQVQFVKGHPYLETTLHQANVLECAGVFILPLVVGDPDSDARTYAIGSIIELIQNETGKPIKTVAELVNSQNLRMLQRANTDGIIVSQGINESMIVQEFLHPGIHSTLQQLITSREGSQLYVHKATKPGKNFRDLQIATLNHPDDIQLIGLIRDGKHNLNPPKTTTVHPGDSLIFLSGESKDFTTFEEGVAS